VAVEPGEEPPSYAPASGTGALVLLADEPRSAWAAEALRAGARAILPSSSSAAEIAVTVEAVAAGLLVLHPDTAATILPLTSTPSSRRSESLTVREIEILRLLADGLANKELAERLGISDHTVKFHIASIFSSSAQAHAPRQSRSGFAKA
jgi:DNA-binding NarL/FixJ family response regulator